MIRQHIYVHRYHWDVIVFYDSTRHDASVILDELDSIGIDDANYMKAARNLEGGYPDTGLTCTNVRERCSVIVLSRASSKAEFANTWFHELFHCAIHIADANDLSPYGEPVAYVGGELAREMQHVAAHLMCPTCK